MRQRILGLASKAKFNKAISDDDGKRAWEPIIWALEANFGLWEPIMYLMFALN